MKRLILMRHAKTEPWHEAVDDHGRALTSLGHNAADAIAAALKTSSIIPDKVIVSTARRTRETWGHLSQVFTSCSCIFEEALYLASVRTLLETIQRHQDADTLMLIGHNPGLHDLAMILIRESGVQDEETASRLSSKFPTGAAAIFEAEPDSAFSKERFPLSSLFIPKDLMEQI